VDLIQNEIRKMIHLQQEKKETYREPTIRNCPVSRAVMTNAITTVVDVLFHHQRVDDSCIFKYITGCAGEGVLGGFLDRLHEVSTPPFMNALSTVVASWTSEHKNAVAVAVRSQTRAHHVFALSLYTDGVLYIVVVTNLQGRMISQFSRSNAWIQTSKQNGNAYCIHCTLMISRML
jgi:hypothetical protein